MSTVEAPERIELRFSEAELALLREKYSKLTDIEFDAFLSAAQRYRLNPLANQFYARLQPATNKNPRAVTYMAQIDGFRLIAERTGDYAGNDDPSYDTEQNKHPGKATVSVHKLVGGQRVEFSASARWAEYCPGGNAAFMWDRMPYLMLGKCAEALALRKAFPTELSGLYTVEEMHQADDNGQESKSASSAPPASEKKDAPRRLDCRAFNAKQMADLVNAAEHGGQLLMALDGAVGGAIWSNLQQRDELLTVVGLKYKQLVGAGVARHGAFEKRVLEYREAWQKERDAQTGSKEELDGQFEQLQKKMEAEAQQDAETQPATEPTTNES